MIQRGISDTKIQEQNEGKAHKCEWETDSNEGRELSRALGVMLRNMEFILKTVGSHWRILQIFYKEHSGNNMPEIG